MDDLRDRAVQLWLEKASDYTRLNESIGAVVDLVLEEAAKEVKAGWVSADYDVVGIRDADMAMKLCEHIAAAIRAMKGELKNDQTNPIHR